MNPNNNKQMCNKDRRSQHNRNLRNNSGQPRNHFLNSPPTYRYQQSPVVPQYQPPNFNQPPMPAPIPNMMPPMQNMLPAQPNGFAPPMMAPPAIYMPPGPQNYPPPMPQPQNIQQFEQPPPQIVPMPQRYYVPNNAFFSPQPDQSQFVPINQPHFQPVPQEFPLPNPPYQNQIVQQPLPRTTPTPAPQQQQMVEPTSQNSKQSPEVETGSSITTSDDDGLCDCKVIILKENPKMMILRGQQIYYQESLFYIRDPEDRIRIIKPPSSEKSEGSGDADEKKMFSEKELAQIIKALTGGDVQLDQVAEESSSSNVAVVADVEEVGEKEKVEKTADALQNDNRESEKIESEDDSDKYFDAVSEFEKIDGDAEQKSMAEGEGQDAVAQVQLAESGEGGEDSKQRNVVVSDLEENQDETVETKPSTSAGVSKNETKKNKKNRKNSKKGSNNKKK
ncbi:unnamed protein product [Caenorhabditis angaria]|uniref:Uncharacterized protein n=1 Tax=Caenorhabditis angaria TaxID=860376 RepID=A0A9P1J2G9_9PELO|nr:unnamed protein product [Caenorhabditis angaria]